MNAIEAMILLSVLVETDDFSAVAWGIGEPEKRISEKIQKFTQ